MTLTGLLSRTFLKAQFSSVVSTLCDFLVTILLTQFLGYWYVFSSCMGTIIGGYVNFSLGRNWAFKKRHGKKRAQARRYILIWTGSLILNVGLLFLLTDILKLHYIMSKSIISVLVGVFFNFYFQKSFVFKY